VQYHQGQPSLPRLQLQISVPQDHELDLFKCIDGAFCSNMLSYPLALVVQLNGRHLLNAGCLDDGRGHSVDVHKEDWQPGEIIPKHLLQFGLEVDAFAAPTCHEVHDQQVIPIHRILELLLGADNWKSGRLPAGQTDSMQRLRPMIHAQLQTVFDAV